MPRRAAEDTLTVLVFGGSQGSRFLNRAVDGGPPPAPGKKGPSRHRPSDGKGRIGNGSTKPIGNPVSARPRSLPIFRKWPPVSEESDLIVSRAGATTCAELIASGKPSLLVPFAGASENHQEPNARELERAGGAEVILEKDLTPEVLAREDPRLSSRTPRSWTGWRPDSRRLRTAGAADGIAELCFRLMEGKA